MNNLISCRVSGGLSQLLKEGPQYDSLNPPAGNTPFGPPDGGQLQPGIQRRFHSSTITRIRRPDGVSFLGMARFFGEHLKVFFGGLLMFTYLNLKI